MRLLTAPAEAQVREYTLDIFPTARTQTVGLYVGEPEFDDAAWAWRGTCTIEFEKAQSDNAAAIVRWIRQIMSGANRTTLPLPLPTSKPSAAATSHAINANGQLVVTFSSLSIANVSEGDYMVGPIFANNAGGSGLFYVESSPGYGSLVLLPGVAPFGDTPTFQNIADANGPFYKIYNVISNREDADWAGPWEISFGLPAVGVL